MQGQAGKGNTPAEPIQQEPTGTTTAFGVGLGNDDSVVADETTPSVPAQPSGLVHAPVAALQFLATLRAGVAKGDAIDELVAGEQTRVKSFKVAQHFRCQEAAKAFKLLGAAVLGSGLVAVVASAACMLYLSDGDYASNSGSKGCYRAVLGIAGSLLS